MAFSLVTLAFVPMSCVNDYGDCPEPYKGADSDRFRLQFQIVTRTAPESRAADIAGDIEGAAAENYIDINNIKYYIFDSAGKFVTDLTPATETVAVNESFTIYNVVAKVDIPFFIQHVDDILDFYILALANYSGWGMTPLPTLAEGDDISMIFNAGMTFTFRPSTPALMLAATPGVPATERQRFPMAGLQRFTVNGSMLLASTDGTPYDISFASGKRLNMLRTMAKIELVDRINIPEGTTFNPETDVKDVRIKSARINGFNTRGSLLPNINLWRLNNTFETQQVIGATIPTIFGYQAPPPLNADNTITPGDYVDYSMPFAYDPVATQRRDDKCPVYSCYVYEYSSASINNLPATQQPYFTVDLAGYTDPDTGQTLVEDDVTLPLRMAWYTDGGATANNNITEILRNHIYRFEITAVRQQLQVSWTVCDMDTAEANIEFN